MMIKSKNNNNSGLSNFLQTMYRNCPPLPSLDGQPRTKWLLQQFNVLCHREPYSYIIYVLYWSFILLFVTPFIGMILLWMGVYETTRHLTYPRRRIQPKMDDNEELAIIITNTDSKFGNELVCRLAGEEGFVVFAGGSSSSSSGKKMKQERNSSGHVIPLGLDVTNEEDVHGAYQTVQDWLTDPKTTKQRYLHALIINNNHTYATDHHRNNKTGDVDNMDLSTYRSCMEGKEQFVLFFAANN